MTARLTSTGRTPALAPSDVERMLTRYFDEDKPSLPTLAQEFTRTAKDGSVHSLSLATVRKYLKAAGIKLPRGRANDLPRVPQKVRTLMNRIPTEMLIGKGRAQLLGRRVERGEGVVALAREFGISKDRVRRLRDRARAEMAPEEAPVVVEDASALPSDAAPVGDAVEAAEPLAAEPEAAEAMAEDAGDATHTDEALEASPEA